MAMSEHQNEILYAKGNMETITIFVSKKIKEGVRDVVGVTNSYRVVNDIMNDWIEKRMVTNIVNDKDEVMTRDQNWVVGERIMGGKNKRVEFFIRVQTTARFYELKSSVWDKCVKEEVYLSIKNTKMKHVKRLGILLGVCVPFASKLWYQKEISKIINEDEENLEIKIEKVYQHEYSGKAMVVYATMDKEEEISKKLINVFHDNEMGIKYVSFKWTSSKGIINAIRMNYYNKDDLHFEVLKGINIHDEMEYEYELASVKEILMNVEVNQKKLFVGVEQGTGKNENNVLVIMHRGMTLYGKEWIRQNYGTKCKLSGNREHESSVMLNREDVPQKVKDVEKFLSDELQSRKKKSSRMRGM